jgi:hypothetical protein
MYEIAEHTADRLVVRRYWSGRGEGWQMVYQGVIFTIGGIVFPYFILTAPDPGGPRWLALLFGSGLLLGPFFFWLSFRQRKRIEEGIYVFDKARGAFELSHRTERGIIKFETYPLDQVKAAVADEFGSEGYACRLVIALHDGRFAALYNWSTFTVGTTERVSAVINAFLGVDVQSN